MQFSARRVSCKADWEGRGRVVSDWGKRYLGWDHFPAMLEALEIESFFTLVGEELAVIQAHRRDTNRLAIAIQVGYMRMTGMALNSVEMIPSAVLAHAASQLAQTPPQLASIRTEEREFPQFIEPL